MAAPHCAPRPPGKPGQPREWDAASYDALPLPHERWGQRLLATLPLRGDETVLDAVRQVAARLAEPAVDYIRLQASARRAP